MSSQSSCTQNILSPLPEKHTPTKVGEKGGTSEAMNSVPSLLLDVLPRFCPAQGLWAGAFVFRGKSDPRGTASKIHHSTPTQADGLTGLHGRGIGGRAGRPSAGAVVGPHSHVVLGVVV